MVLHVLVFLLGLYAVTTATGWHMFLTAFILSLILGLMPYDAFLPALTDTLANPSLNDGNSSGKIFIDVTFRPAVHFVILCLGGMVLRRFMASLSTGA